MKAPPHIDTQWQAGLPGCGWRCKRCGETQHWSTAPQGSYLDAEKAFIRSHRRCVEPQKPSRARRRE